MIFDKAARILYESQDRCYACKEEFHNSDISYRKVISHHCHFTSLSFHIVVISQVSIVVPFILGVTFR